jgi:hypothetical protein
VSTVWSCGGGTQSAAIAALIVRGELPKPDAAVIADTGREASETWRYFDAVLHPQLASAGVNLVRLPHSFEGTGWNTVDLYDRRMMPLIPTFTSDGGQTRKFCSNEWKARPVERYYRSLGLTGGRIWIGFTIDEWHRARSFDPRAAWNHDYPLIDRRMNRADCLALVERMGWPAPPRSSCWMCPYRSDAEWLRLKRTDPADFDRAIALEREIQAIDADQYLHRAGRPLDTVNLNETQQDLFDSCGSGMCFT